MLSKNNLFKFFLFFFPTFIYSQYTDEFIKRLNNQDKTISEKEIQNKLDSIHLYPIDKQAFYYVVLGEYYYSKNKNVFKASKYYYQTIALNDLEKNSDYLTYTMARAYNNLGILYYDNFFQNEIALTYYKKSLALLLSYGKRKKTIERSYSNIANIFYNERLIDSGNYYLRKGISYSLKENIVPNVSYRVLAKNHPNLDSSFYYAQKAFPYYSTSSPRNQIVFYKTLADLEVKKNNLKKADSLYQLSQTIAHTNNINSSFASLSAIGRGKISILNNHIDQGIKTISNEIPSLLKRKKYNQLENVYQTLENAYVKKGDYTNAYKTLKKSNKNDSIYKAYKAFKQNNGTSIFNEHLHQLKIEKEVIKSKNSFYLFLISLLLILIIIIFFGYKKFQKKHRINNNIIHDKNNQLHTNINSLRLQSQQAHQELLFKSILINEKQSFLKELASDIKILSSSIPIKKKNEFMQLYKKIQINLKENLGNEFEYHFEKVHPHFFKELHLKYHNITKKEVRLAALIKLNFDTKEISEITKQTVTAINTAKSRLKAKLNLTKDQSLYTYIQNI